MINTVDLEDAAKENDYRFAVCPFYKDGKAYVPQKCAAPDSGRTQTAGITPDSPNRLDSENPPHSENPPLWGMSLRAAGSMRFRWTEDNPNRTQFLAELSEKAGGKKIIPLELIHSKNVFCLKSGGETFGKRGDGMVTENGNLIPVITVADCVPVYFYDCKNGAFGIVHSGWKGTGIAVNAINLMKSRFGSRPENILVAVGAHIHDCCYRVDSERAEYFIKNFGKNCVHKSGKEDAVFLLSLLQANLNIMLKAGIKEENIVAAKNCTCCSERFGSFRREAAFSLAADKSRAFTVQAAFVTA